MTVFGTEDEFQETQMSSDDSSFKEFDSKDYEKKQLQLLSSSFKSREDLISSTKEIYMVQGYALSIKCSKKEKYVVLGCDRGGCYRNKLNIPAEDRKRKSGSRLINCPFQLRGKKQLEGSWTLQMENDLHNHEPSSDMSGHPSCRQLSEEQTLVIERMTRAGVQTRQILSSLRQENVNTKVVSHKGRPQGSMNKRNSSCTKRNLSEFEIVEKTRKCSVCGFTGHNSRSCRGKNNVPEYMDCYTPCLVEEENIVSDPYNLSEDFSRNSYVNNEERLDFFDL